MDGSVSWVDFVCQKGVGYQLIGEWKSYGKGSKGFLLI